MEAARDGGTLALDENELDRIELALAGYLPATLIPHCEPGTHRIFTDPEGTPIARWDGAILHPERPLARGLGLAWDSALRRSALHASLPNADTHILPISAPVPTRVLSAAAEAAAATARPGRISRLIVVALVSRSAPQHGALTANAITAIVSEARAHLAAEFPAIQCDALVAPWPRVSPPPLQRIADALNGQLIADLPPAQPGEMVTAETYLPGAALAVRAATSPWQHRGAVLLFTGLSGSGKSTIARALAEALAERYARVELLDGDAFRRSVSTQLGFDRASRVQNVINIAEAATARAKERVIAIAAPIAPFEASRAAARAIVSPVAPFYLIHVSTPLEVCEARDRKGLYAKARKGEISEFTGISSPYEVPTDADLTIDASQEPTERSVGRILAHIVPTLSQG